MALVLADRVLETCSAPGTGTVTLGGAVTGYQSFASAIGNNNTCFYTIADQNGSGWEVGVGTVSTSGGNTLARTTVLASSNAGSAVNFSTGTQNVFVTYPAEKSVYLNASGNVSALGTISSATWNATAIASAYGGTGQNSSSWTGLAKITAGVWSQGTAGTDYAPATSGTSILYGNGSGGFSNVTIGTGISFAGGTLSATGSGGTVTTVSWTGGIVTITNPTTTPSFTIAGTSGGIPYFSSASTWATSGALTANAFVLGGGAGAAPATTTTGTGVVTAVGNSVNTTGGLVTQSGTLAASSFLLGGGSGTAISSTTTGTGVVTAVGNAVNTTNGLVTQTATLTASALLLGGGSGTGISSTTTGTGVVTALGIAVNTGSGGLVTNTGTATLTNKKITPRSLSLASTSGAITPDSDTYDQVNYSLTGSSSFSSPTATTVTNGQKLTIRLYAASTQTISSWNAIYRAIGVTLPTSVPAGKTIYVGCIYNSTDTTWDVVSVATQA